MIYGSKRRPADAVEGPFPMIYEYRKCVCIRRNGNQYDDREIMKEPRKDIVATQLAPLSLALEKVARAD